MGLFDFLRRFFFGTPAPPADGKAPPRSRHERRRARHRPRPRLDPLRYDLRHPVPDPAPPESAEKPYRFAQRGGRGRWLDLSKDGDDAQLGELALPRFRTPEELAAWLELSPGRLAWLTHRYKPGRRPDDARTAHYHFHWIRKRRGGFRLIEAPKRTLRAVQRRILEEIVARIPPHQAAHGFVPGRSIVTNASPHAGRRVVVKLDLENFYANVRFDRVVAIFRRVGYCREAAIWLGRLTTSALPGNISFPGSDPYALEAYQGRHLPQGGPTSPALANLSAYSLDVRLSGLARKFGASYTRYADDLTFSGDERFLKSLAVFLPLASQIVTRERFRLNKDKRRVLRNNQRQTVTGVVVNAKPNVGRADFDRLKAILTNCVRHGPASQNRGGHPDFASHLRGRIAHVQQLHPERGAKLLALYGRIAWGEVEGSG
ncbi:MAG: reverse transcriptase family protein [Planctomycetaceae bacterium]